MAGTRRVRAAGTAAAGAVFALLLGAALAGCSGNQNASSAGDAAVVGGGTDAERAPDAAAPERSPGSSVNRATVQTRAVIRTGQVSLTASDLDRIRQRVDELLFAFEGSVDSEQTSHDAEGRIERSTLVLRVPTTKFNAAMEALAQLGKVRDSDSRAKDVTTQVIDVDERVETLQNSLDRLQDYQRDAADIDDLIRFEEQITERESQLQSLKAQQSYLADQTSMATITLHLSTPEKFVEPPGALDDAGFLSGLRGGWDALKGFVVVLLTVAGAVLPFAVALAVVGVPVALLVRALARRRTPPEPEAAEPDAG